MYSQGSLPEGGVGSAFISSMQAASAAGCPPPAPPPPVEELEEEFPPVPLDDTVVVFCEGSSEHPHRQATTVTSKSQRFMTAPFFASNEPRFRRLLSRHRLPTR